ncbi:hypothetical protein ACFLXT_05050 [Chloroflexota bacterium]
MRTAAGILMIICAVMGIVLLRVIYGNISGLLGWLPWLWAALVGGGGIYTLKRKKWKLSLISSVLIIPISILPFLAWSAVLADVSGEETNIPFAIMITLLFLAAAILPIVFVYLRKTEWES